MEELSGIDGIEALQFHENCCVDHSALSVMENHFSGEEENGRILPVLGQGHEFLQRLITTGKNELKKQKTEFHNLKTNGKTIKDDFLKKQHS